VGKIYRTSPDWPCDPPSILYNVYRVYPGVLWRGRGVDHPPPSNIECEGMSGRFSKSCIAIRAQRFCLFVIHTLNFPPYNYAIVKSNEIILEMSVSNREKIYSHAKFLEHQVTFQTAIGKQKAC